MSTGKTTPGPWIVREMGEDCFVEGNEVVGRTIAGDYKREILSDEDYPRKKADARLIAAAPELLEACKAARDILASSGLDEEATFLLLHRAIQKAEVQP